MSSHLVVFVNLVHAALTLNLSDNLTGILHDDLVGLEAAVAANAVTTIRSLDNLNTNSVLAAPRSTGCEISESTVGAMLLPDIAVVLVALVQHDSVLAAFATTVLRLANALGRVIVEVRRLAPVVLGVANEAIYIG
jgi:hypothetical protein